MPVIRFLALLSRLIHAGARPEDDEEQRLRLSLLNLASLLFGPAALIWLLIGHQLDTGFTAAPGALVPLLVLLNYALFPWHRHFARYRGSQLGLMLIFPLLTLASLPSTPATSGLALWAVIAPACALLTVGNAASNLWFIGFLGLTALSAGLGPQAGSPLFMALHVILVSGVLYPLLRFALRQRGKTRARLAAAHRQLRREQERSERLLLNILPAPIAARLKEQSGTIADGHPEVVVMFADIVNYTRIASDMPPKKVFALLNRIFCRFDELTEERGLERIKTIGDGYMVAGGLNAHPREPHAAAASLALAMQSTLRDPAITDSLELELRIGIASGPVVAGVVGRGKFIYDLWGDTVNLAYRLCTEGEPSAIQCDGQMFERLRNTFVFAKPLLLFLKGKGYVPVYRLRSPRIFAVSPAARRRTPEAA